MQSQRDKMVQLLDSLTAAHGGANYTAGDVGRAIASRISRDGWSETPGLHASRAAELMGQRRGDDSNVDQDTDEIETVIMQELDLIPC